MISYFPPFCSLPSTFLSSSLLTQREKPKYTVFEFPLQEQCFARTPTSLQQTPRASRCLPPLHYCDWGTSLCVWSAKCTNNCPISLPAVYKRPYFDLGAQIRPRRGVSSLPTLTLPTPSARYVCVTYTSFPVPRKGGGDGNPNNAFSNNRHWLLHNIKHEQTM